MLATLTDAAEAGGSPQPVLLLPPVVLLERAAVLQVQLLLRAQRPVAELEPPQFLLKRGRGGAVAWDDDRGLRLR